MNGRLEVRGLSKRYGPVRALQSVDAIFEPGEVHAVLGANGAGKSTLVSVLAGFVTPDEGSVLLDGKPLPLGNPLACRHAGVAMVHQHFTLVPEFTVRENLALFRVEGLAETLDLAELSEHALDLARKLEWPIDPSAKIRDLPVGAQQRVEILKNLADDSPILILDEPTAVLGPEEIEDLFKILKDLASEGRTVVLIAHKLAEVMSVADRVTVLRKGRFVATAPIGEVDEDILARWMVGEIPETVANEPSPDLRPGLILRSATAMGDRGETALRSLDLEIARGEIVGVGGVDGNGQVELAEVAVGVRDLASGERLWSGGAERVAYIPQDRQAEGLAMSMSIEENLLIEGHRRTDLFHRGFMSHRAAREWSTQLAKKFDIKIGSVTDPISSLSGGNQQKAVVARCLDQTPDLLVCVNPTRGLDIAAANFVRGQIRRARDGGAAVLLISTDLDELAELATRTCFISGGRILARTDAASLLGGKQ